jgi:hypothetical protein
MKFYREGTQYLLFAHLGIGEARQLEEGRHQPTQVCVIEQSDIHSRLQSGNQYTLFDTVRGLYICRERGSYGLNYATVTDGDSTRHKLRKPGGGPIVSGDEIYIQAMQSEILNHYLRPDGRRNDLYYQDGDNPTSDHIWIIESPAHAQGQPIWTYDSITLKSKAQQRYMAANGAGSGGESDYLSVLSAGLTRTWEVRL